MAYILRALDKEGNIHFYTGKAGMEWMSSYRESAFRYATEQAALWKSKSFNRMEPVHGYWFIVQPVQVEPA
jgi:hypothetical protein